MLTPACSLYFSGQSRLYVHTRPLEVLFRDPWWVFTVCSLFYMVKSRYDFGYAELVRVSPTFAILFSTMFVSLVFIFADILAVTHIIKVSGLPNGINPFWKLAFVFKCFTDTVVLDDFKTALDGLKQRKLQQIVNVLNHNVRRNSNESGDCAQMHAKSGDQTYELDISNPLDFMRPNAQRPLGQVRTTANTTLERVDVEAALREVTSTSQSLQ